VAGFTSVSDTVPNARFVVHYNETFADRITRTWAPNSSYDALYVVAYAAYAAAGALPSGDVLARAVDRLQPPGAPIDVGPTGIFEAYGALARGEHIDLNGATGSLDFDPQTGDAPVDLAALCAAVDAHGAASESIESGVVFEAKASRLAGEPRCP
jgi:branched-chain amino acid transport system substrate-binding protein